MPGYELRAAVYGIARSLSADETKLDGGFAREVDGSGARRRE